MRTLRDRNVFLKDRPRFGQINDLEKIFPLGVTKSKIKWANAIAKTAMPIAPVYIATNSIRAKKEPKKKHQSAIPTLSSLLHFSDMGVG